MVFPRNLQRRYEALVKSLIVALKKDMQAEIVRLLPMIENLLRSGVGATQGFQTLNDSLDRVLAQFRRKLEAMGPEIMGVGERINSYTEEALAGALGVGMLLRDQATQQAVELWAAESKKKLSALAQQHVEAVSGIVLMGFRKGFTPVQMRSAVLDTFRSADKRKTSEARGLSVEDRATAIARDQVTTLVGQVNETRQRTLGLGKYIWDTAADERVRPEHAALHGQIMSWDDPPSFGHPGMDWGCRCVALPYVEDTSTDA
jgi:SPP1 gp7 family putative phage head morphogenesis protein